MRLASVLVIGGFVLGHAGCSVANDPGEPVDPLGQGGGGTGTCVPPFDTLESCGACGAACDPANVVGATCEGGTCSYDSCAAGFDDCDGDTTNGCEADVTGDVNNCGSCGNACAGSGLPNTMGGACESSACTFACAAGFDDCDMDASNGCEEAVSSLDQCGACGTPCAPQNVMTAECDTGTCGYDMCVDGFDDCDDDTANGCEADLSQGDNCGACGTMCTGSQVCTPTGCADPPSCQAIKQSDPNAADGDYMIDPDGQGGDGPISVYCDMTTDGGGWTECLSVVNTAQEDILCSDTQDQQYFHRCVDWTMAPWSGADVMVQLIDGANKVYEGYGTRGNPWTYQNLTAPGGTTDQFNRLDDHPNAVTLNNNHLLSISAFNAGNNGWGGAWGLGSVLVVTTSPCYACDIVVSLMGYRGTTPPPDTYNCQMRNFDGFTEAHELMYNANGGIMTEFDTTLTPQQAFLGELKFLVR